MRVYFKAGIFVAEFPYTSREMVKAAGFVFNKYLFNTWATRDLEVALGLERWFDESALRESLKKIVVQDEAIHRSACATSEFHVPTPPGLELLPFQKAGVEAALRFFGDIT